MPTMLKEIAAGRYAPKISPSADRMDRFYSEQEKLEALFKLDLLREFGILQGSDRWLKGETLYDLIANHVYDLTERYHEFARVYRMLLM